MNWSTEDFFELHAAVRERLAAGTTRAEVIEALTARAAELRAAGDGAGEDTVAEVLDCFAGWCSRDWVL